MENEFLVIFAVVDLILVTLGLAIMFFLIGSGLIYMVLVALLYLPLIYVLKKTVAKQ